MYRTGQKLNTMVPKLNRNIWVSIIRFEFETQMIVHPKNDTLGADILSTEILIIKICFNMHELTISPALYT